MEKKRHYLVLLQLVFVVSFFSIFIIVIQKPTITGFTIFENQPDPVEGKDTYIRNETAINYGNATLLKIGLTASGRENRALLEFNVSSISSGDTVTSGLIQVYASSLTGENVTIEAYRLTTSWDEGTGNAEVTGDGATWDNRTSSASWTTEGGDYFSTALSTVTITGASDWYNLTITDAVSGWVNGSYSNFGIVLIPQDGTGNSNLTEIVSSDYTTDTSLRPTITIDHTDNAAPTISSITLDSNLTNNIIKVGESILINVSWTDSESDDAQSFICNSSTINTTGCDAGTFCNTSLASTNPASCSYTILESDNRTTNFWAAVCDSNNCSIANQSFFNMNHIPVVLIGDPNGSETVNQSQGNYVIEFNVSDSDSDFLTSDIYYSETQNETTSVITSDLNLTSSCSDTDSDTSTTNNCTYSWNSTGITGNYFITIIVNDTYHLGNDSSDGSFSVQSVNDNEAPNITSQYIEGVTIYSGRSVQFYTNVSDTNIQTVWFSVNTTPQQNITMSNTTTALTYNGTLVAPEVATYEFKVYANDSVGNLNDSLSAQTFNVTKPTADPQNITAPPIALPFSTIKITSQLNATDALRDVFAFLYVPVGFSFLSGYDQNTNTGNYSEGENVTATWFVAAPIATANYTLNVTFTDDYSNTWNSSNAYVDVKGDESYTITIAGYPEVETGANYFTEAFFTNNGVLENADSVVISIYDSIGSLIVGPASMNNPATGEYNYTYTVGSSVNEGQWETIVNATKNSISYFVNQFWHVVGGPFDVRDIAIDNAATDNLQISVIVENTGGAIKDITMVWNLSREDTGVVIDSGSDTFAVAANTQTTYEITPDPSGYTGQSRVTFLGYWSDTERAGAFEVFTITAAGGGGDGGGSSGGGGGGSGATTSETTTGEYSLSIDTEEEIALTRNIKKTVKLEIENTGEEELSDISLEIQGLSESYYRIISDSLDNLGLGETGEFLVEFLISGSTEEEEFLYVVKSNELVKTFNAKLIVLEPNEFFLREINRLEKDISNLRDNTNKDKFLKELDICEGLVSDAKSFLIKEQFINVKNTLGEAEACIDDVDDKIKGETVSTSPDKMGNIFWIITLLLVIILIVVLVGILYVLHRKLNVFSFMKKQEMVGKVSKPKSVDTTNLKKKHFEDKIAQIEDKLKK